MATLDLDVEALAVSELPVVLGRVCEFEARIRLRLAAPVGAPQATPQERIMDADEGAALAGCSRRWLLSATRGRGFRCDLSRKQPRFREAGLRRWLAERKAR